MSVNLNESQIQAFVDTQRLTKDERTQRKKQCAIILSLLHTCIFTQNKRVNHEIGRYLKTYYQGGLPVLMEFLFFLYPRPTAYTLIRIVQGDKR